MFDLNGELQKLKNRGETSLVAELESLIEATSDDAGNKETSKTSVPLSHQFLAIAAQQIREGNLTVGHDCLGVAIEAYLAERGSKEFPLSEKLIAHLSKVEIKATAETDPFMLPLPDAATLKVETGSPTLEESNNEIVSSFVNILLNAGYTVEAKAYLEGYNQILSQGGDGMKSDRETMERIKAKFTREGNLAMAKHVGEILAEMDEEEAAEGEEKAAEEPKEEKKENTEMSDKPSITPTELTDPNAPVVPEEKPVLEVEAPTEEEEKAKEEATAAMKSGDSKKAKECLAKARKLERHRLIAALIKAGDTDLAMEGLDEEEKEQGGYKPEECSVKEDKAEVEKESELPAEKKEEVKIDEAVSEPEVEKDEESMAKEMADEVVSCVKGKKIKKAKEALSKLNELEQAIVASVKVAEEEKKDEALAREGYICWRKVKLNRLTATVALAEAEGEKEEMEKAAKAAKDLEEEMNKDPEATAKEVTETEVVPQGGFPVGQEQPETPFEELDALDDEIGEDEEGKEESDAMKYEVLQGLEQVKAMKVDRNNLGFMLWDNQEDPHWVVQANGKPVAEIHLQDQDNAEDIKAYFCNENTYPQALAQSLEKVGLYDMLKGVKARFYANEINKTDIVKKAKEEAVASLDSTRKEKLATLRKDLSDAIVIAAEALNKGVMRSKPNALKASFAKVLASYGIQNPAIAVESAFNDGFMPFIEQVIADAQEYLEMPKEAFDHYKKIVANASNLSFAQANQVSEGTFGQRLANNSMPLASVPEAMEAPVVQDMVQASAREAKSGLKSRLSLSRK